jgi:hypothetical protein
VFIINDDKILHWKVNSGIGSIKTENYALNAILETGAADAEMADLGCALDVGAGTETFVVVADMDDADGGSGAVGKAVEVETLGDIVLHDKLHGDRQIKGNNLVDFGLDSGDFGRRKFARQGVIELGLGALHMSILGTLAAEHFDHGAVENVLGSVHWREFGFVVLVENWLLWHNNI